MKLHLEKLTKAFGITTAIDHLSISVKSGGLTGFVGANSAGKTTTMRLIMGLLTPDKGSIHWQDRAITRQDQSQFGYMPEERGLYPKQRVADQLVYLAKLHKLSTRDAKQRTTNLLERFNLIDHAKRQLETLSLGNQQKVQFIAALVHRPSALILDEPFSGLDPEAVDEMSAMLNHLSKQGVPVLFSSHQLDLVERLCQQVVIIQHGRLVASGSVDELRAVNPPRYRLACRPNISWLHNVEGVTVISSDETEAMFYVSPPTSPEQIAQAACKRGVLYELARVPETLNEIYKEVTR